MATLLHVHSSVFPGAASASRTVTTTCFPQGLGRQHPQGTVIYRDLAVNPVPHITADAHTAGFAPADAHTPEQAAAFAERLTFIEEELEQADAILIGAPMYNFTIPSTLEGVAGPGDPHRPYRHERGLEDQGHPGHGRRQPRRLLRAGHPARGLRVRPATTWRRSCATPSPWTSTSSSRSSRWRRTTRRWPT